MERSSANLWRKINSRYNLVGCKCQNCGTLYFPSRVVCRKCGRDSKITEAKFSGNGVISSYTNIRVPPDSFKDEAPYTIAIVKLDEGPSVEGHVVESGGEVKIGSRVRAVFRKMYVEGDEGLIYYHYKFELV
jgi:uncharacterized OB-fold protein